MAKGVRLSYLEKLKREEEKLILLIEEYETNLKNTKHKLKECQKNIKEEELKEIQELIIKKGLTFDSVREMIANSTNEQ